MNTFIQAFIISFREGLEALLIITILLNFLDKSNNKKFKKDVWLGAYTGIFSSFILGGILVFISSSLLDSETISKIWESIASLIAVILITTLIVWMIKYGHQIKEHIEKKATLNLSHKGLFLLSTLMVLREGGEITIFTFVGKYSFLPIILGLIVSVAILLLIHRSIININLKTIFNATLIYLIIQSGFLMGYGIHEGLSALKSLNILTENSPLLIKAFDLSKTSFNSKQGIFGLPLYIAFGWYSKPEWIQFISQYSYSAILLSYWYQIYNSNKLDEIKYSPKSS